MIFNPSNSVVLCCVVLLGLIYLHLCTLAIRSVIQIDSLCVKAVVAFLFPYETVQNEIRCGEISLNIEHLASLDRTIDLFFADYEVSGRAELFADLCPYFGVPWPAGQVLATYAAKESQLWKGKKILELGCGLALPSLVLSRLGFAATATDLHPDVPEFLRRNIILNQASTLQYEALDWRSWAGASHFDVILASDVLYDKAQPQELISFLTKQLQKNGEFILADPGRPYFDSFLAQAKKKFIVQESLIDGIFFLQISAKDQNV